MVTYGVAMGYLGQQGFDPDQESVSADIGVPSGTKMPRPRAAEPDWAGRGEVRAWRRACVALRSAS